MSENCSLSSVTSSYPRLLVWLVSVSFVLLQFCLQLSSGVVISSIMKEFSLSATIAGLIGSSFYFVYTALQIPAGFLFDKKNPRIILVMSALMCSLGCFIFAHAHFLWTLMLGRLLIGFGSAFAFVGLCYVLRMFFPKNQFAFMIGFSETLGFFVAASAIVSFGTYIERFGWRYFIESAVVIGCVISLCCWLFISSEKSVDATKKQMGLFDVFFNSKLWINGFFVGLSFSVVTVFAAFWLAPFIQVKLNASVQQASQMTAIFFVGAGISCPVYGLLSNHIGSRRLLTFSSCILTAILTMTFIYLPSQSIWIPTALLFLSGIVCGAYMLAFTISNEIAPAHLLSTAAGFTNTLAMLTAPLFQPVIGMVIDLCAHHHYTILQAYQYGLSVIPAALIIAGILSVFLPERT